MCYSNCVKLYIWCMFTGFSDRIQWCITREAKEKGRFYII